LNGRNIASSALSDRLKLLHSRYPIDELSEMNWENRSQRLLSFIAEDGWLWSTGTNGLLSHGRLLAWLRAPRPGDLQRYYRCWDIEDIFSRITRTPSARSKLWLGVQELVDIRNNIAHGDFTAQPTQADIQRYTVSARTFCERADGQLARALGKLTIGDRPW
jgi:RiboL-PSP-HEPN